MNMRLLLILLFAACLLAEDADPWRSDYDAAVEEARSAPARPLAVLVSHPTCAWCTRMKEESAGSEAVRRAAGDVIAVILDAAERPELAALAGIDSYPTLILVNRSGREVRRVKGYLPPNDLATVLRVLALNGDAQGGGSSVLAKRIDPPALAATSEGRQTLIGLLGLGAPALRLAIREALAARPEAKDMLWPLLTHRRLTVRADAAAILAGGGNRTHGYDPFAPAAERAAAAERWKNGAAIEELP